MRDSLKKNGRRVAVLVIGAGVTCTFAAWLVVRISPLPQTRYERALTALQAGDLKTVAAAARSLELVPDFEERARYLRAACLTKTGKRDEALAELRLEPQADELRVPMLLLIAESHYREGRLAEAEAAARRALDEDPGSADAHRWLASILYDLGASQAAIAELNEVVQLAPQDFSPHHFLATIEFDAERYQQAAQAYRAALERSPPQAIRPALVRGLMQALVAQHEYAAALAVGQTEGRRDALVRDSLCLALEAECRWNLGEPELARNLLDEAAQIDAHEPRLLRFRAQVLIESGQPAAAVPLLEELLEKDQHDFESRYRLSLACRKLREPARADDELRRMHESQALRRKLTDLSELAVARPRDAQVRDELAAVCEQLAKPELARLYRQAADACRRSNQ